jgi:predicted nucleotidyltransferase
VEENQALDFLDIFKILSKHKVDFIVVGGVCAVLHGAPVTTFDLDLVHSRSPDNLERLMTSLHELDAYYRGRGGQRLKPGVKHLSSPGHQLLITKAGPLDLLGTIGHKHSYVDLIKHTVEFEVGGLRFRILNLGKLIEIKKETITEKDKAVIPILQRTLEEKTKNER